MNVELDALLAHRAFLHAIARALLFDEQLAEDVVQETYLTAIAQSTRPRRSWKGWLAGITRNLAKETARTSNRRERREAEAAAPERLPSSEEIVEKEAIRRRVVDAVLALDQPYRDAILHRYYEGLPPREIARRLGVPVETVRTRVKRGIERLRERLDAEHGGRRGAWSAMLTPFASVPSASPLVP